MITADNDTIAAISTPIGFGGIGIVRISGPEAASIARKVFRRSAAKEKVRIKNNFEGISKGIIPRRLHYGYVVEPENQEIFNEVLMVYMPSPNSYTREDVIEIQAHGGTAALKDILEIVNNNGARLADPGEFTRRAYLNGRIDLSQAEAIIDVIQAKTDASLRIANRNLEGEIGHTVRAVRRILLEIKVMLETQIDFHEDVEERLDEKKIPRMISQEVLTPINKILEGYRNGHLLREGARIVILGRTNVGKSSLLNRFLKRERAIVTSYPGTTRDCLEESVSLFGIPTVVVDTAGWRNTNDPVEIIGIERTRDLAQSADLILFMVDAHTGIVPEDENLYLKLKDKEKILIINKSDLLKGENKIKIPASWRFSEILYTSAKFGHGFESMKESLYKVLAGGRSVTEGEVVPNLRQKNLFEKAHGALVAGLNGLSGQVHPELIAIDIQEAMDALDEITGDTVKPQILDEIFSRFCIGK